MSSSLNRVMLMGNLTRDPEVRFTPKGMAVGDFGIAINDSYKSQDGTMKEQVTFVDVEVWGRQAENCKQFLAKGRPVFIEGSLKFEQWEKNGVKQSKLKVRADRVQFLNQAMEKQRPDGNREDPRESQEPLPARGSMSKSITGLKPGEEDDIPF